jgi:hypothetical protein
VSFSAGGPHLPPYKGSPLRALFARGYFPPSRCWLAARILIRCVPLIMARLGLGLRLDSHIEATFTLGMG